jgi:hypothetical protein
MSRSKLNIAWIAFVPVLFAQAPEEVADTSIFIYAPTDMPCAASASSAGARPPVALGTGFSLFLSAGKKSPEGRDLGLRFLITAGHVIAGRSSVVLRMNRSDKKGFACQTVDLVREGPLPKRTVHQLINQPQVDIAAIRMPNIPDADPTSFNYSMILDKAKLAELHVHVGTDVFTVGYMFGYAGLSLNYPITRFGKVALMTEEYWLRPDPKTGKTTLEQGYVIELQNVPGLSGAPVMLSNPQWSINPKSGVSQTRNVPPYILGVIKDLMLSPAGGSQGVAVIEPGERLRELLRAIASDYQAAGAPVILEQ